MTKRSVDKTYVAQRFRTVRRPVSPPPVERPSNEQWAYCADCGARFGGVVAGRVVISPVTPSASCDHRRVRVASRVTGSGQFTVLAPEAVLHMIEEQRAAPPFSGLAAVEAYCSRPLDAQTMPDELKKAVLLTDHAGWLTLEARSLCDPYRVPPGRI